MVKSNSSLVWLINMNECDLIDKLIILRRGGHITHLSTELISLLSPFFFSHIHALKLWERKWPGKTGAN